MWGLWHTLGRGRVGKVFPQRIQRCSGHVAQGHPKEQETFARVSGYCEQVRSHLAVVLAGLPSSHF